MPEAVYGPTAAATVLFTDGGSQTECNCNPNCISVQEEAEAAYRDRLEPGARVWRTSREEARAVHLVGQSEELVPASARGDGVPLALTRCTGSLRQVCNSCLGREFGYGGGERCC